jgi:hypothetical protein
LRGILSPPCGTQVRHVPRHFKIIKHRHLTHRHIDDIDNIVSQFPAVVGCEIVAAALDEEDLAVKFSLEGLQRAHVGADVLANRGVRASSCLDGEDTLRGQGLVFDEELLILSGENIVCDSGYEGMKEVKMGMIRLDESRSLAAKLDEPRFNSFLRRLQSSRVRAVFPEPTGLELVQYRLYREEY